MNRNRYILLLLSVLVMTVSSCVKEDFSCDEQCGFGESVDEKNAKADDPNDLNADFAIDSRGDSGLDGHDEDSDGIYHGGEDDSEDSDGDTINDDEEEDIEDEDDDDTINDDEEEDTEDEEDDENDQSTAPDNASNNKKLSSGSKIQK